MADDEDRRDDWPMVPSGYRSALPPQTPAPSDPLNAGRPAGDRASTADAASGPYADGATGGAAGEFRYEPVSAGHEWSPGRAPAPTASHGWVGIVAVLGIVGFLVVVGLIVATATNIWRSFPADPFNVFPDNSVLVPDSGDWPDSDLTEVGP